jgi:uncharacterized cupin superfamily protein
MAILTHTQARRSRRDEREGAALEVEGGQPGFRYRRARLDYQAGCERLGVSLWELPPSEATPYGDHHGNEELLVVVSGRPRMRTPEGRREWRHRQSHPTRTALRGAPCAITDV